MEDNENKYEPSFAHESYPTDAPVYPYYAQPVSYPHHYGYTHDERGIWPILPFLFLTPFLLNSNKHNYAPYPYPYPTPYPSPYPYPTPYPAPYPPNYYGANREE